MIKELIYDIAYEKIKLTQGLTRAKLIAKQIKNNIFLEWLKKELEGYNFNDKELPLYRKINSSFELVAKSPYGQKSVIPMPAIEYDDKAKDIVYYHRVIEPISLVEHQIEKINNGKEFLYLPEQIVDYFNKLIANNIEPKGSTIIKVRRRIDSIQLNNIIELTKQKLIDILQDLNSEFPNFDMNYIIPNKMKDKVKTIITNNIYSNEGSINVASGKNITQKNLILNNIDKEKLKKIGVENEHIIELENITKKNNKGSENRRTKIMNWLSKVSASVTSKGISEKIPELIEYIGNIM